MYGLTVIDLLVIFGYMASIVWVGIWAGRSIKSKDEYIIGERKYGKFVMILHSFAASTSTSAIVGVASKTFAVGVSGIWYLWLYLFATPFFYIIAPIFRRLRALTTGDFFLMRFDKNIELLYSILGVVMQVLIIAVTIKAGGALVNGCTSGLIPARLVMIILSVIFVLYGVTGGLKSTMTTDIIQGILTLVFSFMLIPFVMNEVGGMSGIREKISNPSEMLSIVAPAGSEITIFYVIVLTFLTLVGNNTLPHIMGICATGKTEQEGRAAYTYGNYIKRVLTIPWTITALAAVVIFAGKTINPDDAFGLLANRYLPAFFPGLMGLFLITVVASILAGCNNSMISASSLFMSNIYKNYFISNGSQQHYINVGRLAYVAISGLSLIVAFSFENVTKGLVVTWIVPAFLGIAFWMGWAWRRYTVKGAWASTITATLLWALTTMPFFVRIVESLPFAGLLHLIHNGEIHKPWVILFFIFGGVIAGIIASYLSTPVDNQKLDHFYGLLRTPVNKPEKLDKPGQLPEGMSYSPQNKLFNIPSLEIQKLPWLSIRGFIVALLSVSLLVAALYAIINWL